MSERRRRDGEDGTPRRGSGSAEAPRVRGAWTTPAVVVRRPDGSVVDPAADRRGAARPRPRRIPGAPGAVRLRPTLTDRGDEPEERRRRRNAAASVTPLPPRPTPDPAGAPGADDDAPPDRVAGADEPAGAHKPGRTARRARGSDLAPIGLPAAPGPSKTAKTKRRASGHGSRRPQSSRPGDRRGTRAAAARSWLDIERWLPADEKARARRALRLRKVGTRAAALALSVVVLLVVFPVRTWINQRAAEERARERQEVFEREIDLLEEEVRDLGTDERVEEEARELGYVRPGEESYGILPAPEAPADGSASSGSSGSSSSSGSTSSSEGSTSTTAPPGG
jgi:cell division protein FtsB